MKYNGNDVFAPFNAGLYGLNDDGEQSLQYDDSKASIIAGFKKEFEADIIARLDSAGLKYIGLEYYSPQFYNYSTDSIDLELEIVDESKLLAKLETLRPKIEAAMKANKSYSGYMALTADSWEDIYKNDDLDILAVIAILSGIDFADFEIYDYLEWEYPCENCERIHGEHDNELPENAAKIDKCIAESLIKA